MNSSVQQLDNVLGYTLTRKIGSGGYGDVWEAEAPGGLRKAIKIVHGFHDEKRALSELKALERIKEVRHPFILSLERFEIVSSKLVVVSELADKSLADLANEFVDQGESGIPRDELLGYVRDAADALDYLNATFGLQHLDVKPENLLLVAGHAKVADFGLVKDIRDAAQSLMSGMTPAYAAPEMFDGRPGHASDQYSLAAVYQEMLTLTRPFSGTTPAQLAAQHMNGKPDLRLLPISDQPVIAKALSKDPGDRYKTCSQFVEQLINRKTRKRVIKSRANVREKIDTNSETVVFGGNESKKHTEMFSNSRLTFNSVELESVDPPDCDSANAQFQPTLVIGVGNTSSQVLQKIKQRMVARHGDADLLPAMGLVCVDSDRDALAKMSVGRDASAIKVSETLGVPLRRSDQYRQHTKLDLSWISRRWIYNVPRSLQTEGLRPLGRLVFVDHFDAICDKISNSIQEVMKVENIASTCETLGLDPPQEPKLRIVVVSNIAGGLGSGMTNDLCYTLRLLAAEQGIKNSEVVGMLMFGEAVGREAGLATANAFAYLSELRHFADGGYPGDARIGLPEFEDDLPFDHAYGIRLNSDSQSSMSDLDKVAEYICLSHTTNCHVFFDAARQKESEHEEFGFRSFGVSVTGPGLQIQGQDAVNKLSKHLIDQWVRDERVEVFCSDEFAKSCFDEFELSLDSTTVNAIKFASAVPEWSAAVEAIENAGAILTEEAALPTFNQIDAYFDKIIDTPSWRQDAFNSSTDLSLAVENEINVEAHELGDKLSLKILDLLNANSVSFPRVQKALKACLELISSEQDSVNNGLHSFGTIMRQLKDECDGLLKEKLADRAEGGGFAEFICNYGKIRVQEFALRCCRDHYRVIKSCLMSTDEMVKKFGLQLKHVGEGFGVKEETKRSAKYMPTIQQMLIDSVDENRPQLIHRMERLVLDSIVSTGDKFLDVLSDSLNWQNQLPAAIKEAAQSVLSNAFKNLSVDQIIAKNEIQPPAIKSWLNEQMNEAMPAITDCGGSAALLIGQPAKAGKSSIANMISDCFDMKLKEIFGTTGDFVVCMEAERILLANVAFSILKDAPEAAEIAKRLASRTDIDWTSLDDLI